MTTLEFLGLMFTAVTCTGGATYFVCSAIYSAEKALNAHAAEDAKVHADVIQLKEERAARRRR